MKAILKYPGSKWRIASSIVELIPPHHSYVEPYFGSGAVLYNKPISNIETVNDMNADIINLFKCIQINENKLAKLVDATAYARDIYEYAYENNDVTDPWEKALKFLIRCWQGHGFRMTGEKVGWKIDVQGREKAYALKDWCSLPNSIINAAQRMKRVQIENRPALEVIKRFNHKKVFMYLDPPYILESRSCKRAQYSHEMTKQDHVELLEVILASKAMIMISGYENDLYNEMLCDWEKVTLKSNDNTGRITNEVVWMNYKPSGQISMWEIEGSGLQ